MFESIAFLGDSDENSLPLDGDRRNSEVRTEGFYTKSQTNPKKE
jgi:hypothetical protein